MAISTSLSYVYGEYLMSPHITNATTRVNKNSFGRLINSYYGKHSLFKKTLPCVYNSGLLDFNEKSKDIAVSLDSLIYDKDLYHTKEKEELEEAVEGFVEDYNSLITSFSQTENQEFSQKTTMLDGITFMHNEELSAIGIVINDDQTLTVDPDVLKVAEVQKLESIFCGKDSYAGLIKERVDLLGKEALSLVAPTPKFYGENGTVNYSVFSGVLFSAYC